ncbi:hypothetical protein [Brevibacillus sp. SYSU BS000544]|uniref:hypothetical protein n=1 Tax=Brevibacillus sp. SYSU BS000544 TaxID=3416443 RepID=UPI003CE456A4
MEYSLPKPPFEVRSFRSLPVNEAEQYFDWFVSQIPDRLSNLNQVFHESGEDTALLNFTPESLTLLWRWFLPQLIIVPRSEEEILQKLEGKREHTKKRLLERKMTRYKYSDKTKMLKWDISIYLAEVFRRQHIDSQIRWGFISNYEYGNANQPVLVGFSKTDCMNSISILDVLCLNIINQRGGDDELLTVFTNYSKMI